MSADSSPARITGIFPAGVPLPARQPDPPQNPPPPPPAPPAVPPGDWWNRRLPTPPAPPTPPVPPDVHVHVDVHVDVHIDPSAWLPVPAEPEPQPRWWARTRPLYQAGCIIVGLPLTGWWAMVLTAAHTEVSLSGAWVVAAIPLTITAFADNVYRAAAAGAHPDLWAPKIRAFVARTLLWSAVISTALSLPIDTLSFILTGVRP